MSNLGLSAFGDTYQVDPASLTGASSTLAQTGGRVHPFTPTISVNPNLNSDKLGQVLVQQSVGTTPSDSQQL